MRINVAFTEKRVKIIENIVILMKKSLTLHEVVNILTCASAVLTMSLTQM